MFGEAHGARRSHGFTLLELLIVVVILGVLAAVVFPRFTVSAAEANKNSCAHNVAAINTAVEKWHFETGSWPLPNLNDIGADADHFPEGVPDCPVDGSQYILNGLTHRLTGHSH